MVSSAAKRCSDGDVANAHERLALVALSPLVPAACLGPSWVRSKSICLILIFTAYLRIYPKNHTLAVRLYVLEARSKPGFRTASNGEPRGWLRAPKQFQGLDTPMLGAGEFARWNSRCQKSRRFRELILKKKIGSISLSTGRQEPARHRNPY